MTPDLTKHAGIRSQKRAIPPLAIDLLIRFGSTERAHGGGQWVFFDKPARRRLNAYAGPLAKTLGEHLDIVAILGDDDKVITVGHRYERVRRS